ncbi:MAG: hypothetical protein IT186_16360 [Acidobacteria bacterium]|nr:hypothetical protein [Acidobacteriota bacterium]MCG3194458.1 hypothetical protein [Thermoanaerobaculia bacterium]MCK6684560.1 hypothetical protein [Thermoanaerobaculia bacterium]
MLTCSSLLRKAGIGALALVFSFQAMAAPTLSHERVACIPPGENAKVTVKVLSDGGLSFVRVYYHAAQYQGDYYLEMRRGEGNVFWAVLPKPKSETKDVVYRFVAMDGEGKKANSEDFKVSVSSPCSSPLNTEETAFANNLVIGIVDMSLPVVPQGFKCDGVVSKIAVKDGEDGVLMPHDECRQILAAAAGVAPVAAGLLIGGAVAAVGTGIVISSGGGETQPVSPARPAANPTSPR